MHGNGLPHESLGGNRPPLRVFNFHRLVRFSLDADQFDMAIKSLPALRGVVFVRVGGVDFQAH